MTSEDEPQPGTPGSSALTATVIVATGLAVLVAFGVYVANMEIPVSPEVGEGATVLPVPREIPEFELVDQAGAPFDRSRLEGRWSLLFFGYTYCPDVCPATMQKLSPVQDAVSEGRSPIQVVFVSVDPERDSSDRMAEYVKFFHPGLLGVTGRPDEIEQLARGVGAFYHSHKDERPGIAEDSYLVDHSSSLFLIDPSASLRAVLDESRKSAEIVEVLGRIRAL